MSWMESTDNGLRMVTRFAGLNLSWLVFVLLGLGVLGLFPATVALFYLARLWVLGETEEPIVKTLWQQYRKSFVSANVVGWAMTAVAGLFFLNIEVIRAADGAVPLFIVVPFLMLMVFLVLLSSVVLPVYVHCGGGAQNTLRKTVLFTLGRLPIACLCAVLIWGMAWLSLALPAFFLFFGGSLSAYSLMWLFVMSMSRIEAYSEVANG